MKAKVKAKVQSMTAHTEHPRCPACGKALYKWMGKPVSQGGTNDTGLAEKPPRTSDPYTYCRNKACSEYGKAEISSVEKIPKQDVKRTAKQKVVKASEPIVDQVELKPKPDKCPNVSNHAPGTRCIICDVQTPMPSPEPDDTEPKAVKEARERIRKAINGSEQYSHNVIGLALTIVAQEMGGHHIADQLIDEYDLTKLFGIEKQI